MSKIISFLTLRAAVETPETFDILKEKYKNIEIDLLSWRDNPTCECGQRVSDFLLKFILKMRTLYF